MTTLNDKFHDLGNTLNNINLINGVLKDTIQSKDFFSNDTNKIKGKVKDIDSDLSKLEKMVLKANKQMTKIKTIAYKNAELLNRK